MSTDNHSAVAGHKEHHFAHHFKDAMHEFIASKEGIWLFMVTEILMFGGLFVGYFIFHALYPEMFAEGASHLNWRMGAFNTIVLIISSWTMALSIHYIHYFGVVNISFQFFSKSIFFRLVTFVGFDRFRAEIHRQQPHKVRITMHWIDENNNIFEFPHQRTNSSRAK